jgi:NAD(P)H-dependent FMN reductase
MKFVGLAGSLRRGSLNRRLLGVVGESMARAGDELDIVEFSEIDAWSYSEDRQRDDGFPASIEALRARIDAAAGLVIASPEYNFSIPGGLKNVIDWLSRYRPVPLRGVPTLLVSASPGLIGGNRGLWALRVPLESMGTPVYPDMYSLPQAGDAFDDAGALRDPERAKRLDANVVAFLDYARRLRA